jgi:hypothetical protein
MRKIAACVPSAFMVWASAVSFAEVSMSVMGSPLDLRDMEGQVDAVSFDRTQGLAPQPQSAGIYPRLLGAFNISTHERVSLHDI